MISGNEQGIGILADALPACRYWALQSGATKSMIEERKNDLQKRKPDFYISTERSAFVNFKTHEPTSAEMNRLGYVYCGHCVVEFRFGADVYCKKELYRKLPPVKLRTIDLLLKRDILCRKSEGK